MHIMWVISIVAIVLCVSTSVYGDYYWRDYDMEIPSDAVLGTNGYYIALAAGSGESNNYGLVPTRIRAGDTGVNIAVSGSTRVEDGIKVLCSSDKNGFTWIRTSTKTFLVDLEGKKLVYGGVQGDTNNPSYRSLNYIGHNGNYIGKVLVNSYEFFYADERTERSSDEFYVLTY